MSMFAAVAALAVGFLFAAPAANAQVPTCTDYRTVNPAAAQIYPNDGHFFTCFNLGGNFQRANAVVGIPQGFPKKGAGGRQFLGAWDILKAQGVKFFYFANRTDANNYFNNTPPYAGQGDGVFASTTARCGQTGYIPHTTGSVIASAIYDTCTYAHTQPPQNPLNPDLNHVTAHESGHAFDFSIAANKGGTQARSRLSGFRTLLLDMSKGDFAHMDAMPTCPLFDTVSLPVTKLEFDLGFPTAVKDPVCTGLTVNKPFKGLSNGQIALKQMPYFFNPPSAQKYSELFAQEFAFLAAGSSSSTFLPLTDRTIANGAQCSFFDVHAYWDTGFPPGPSNPDQTAFGKFPMTCPQPPENTL